MPRRDDIHTILIIGAGPIVIGQACEFDYSGVQACKALRAEGYRVVLVNSNPATIMTDPGLADATYIEPITPEFVEKIIIREKANVPKGRVFALLPTMGGQTALNTALDLDEKGVLAAHGVEMIGAKARGDREGRRPPALPRSDGAHRARMSALGVRARHEGSERGARDGSVFPRSSGPRSRSAAPAAASPITARNSRLWPQARSTSRAATASWSRNRCSAGRNTSWRSCATAPTTRSSSARSRTSIRWACTPATSITVAPALTLTDKEYQRMRTASIAVLREIGVETGGSNVQFAINPVDGRMVVIEMNPRVSRSSALASKATGFPIAKVAAKLAVGYTLDELTNDITRVTPASFEPTIDYVVTKIPRFAFEKFPGADPMLTTSMKSVGEVMAIGRTFAESMQKALRSLETGLTGFDDIAIPNFGQGDDSNAIRAALGRPTPDRLRFAAQALRLGVDEKELSRITGYDPWFVGEIAEIIRTEAEVKRSGLPRDASGLRRLKAMGFSDARLATLAGKEESDVSRTRAKLGVHPVYKRIDTCAAEFAALTSYMYSTYETPVGGEVECEAWPSDKRKAIILGGGPNRIGQGIEFDYCCCHACFALAEQGFETIMINCNPETVSTDYDTSNRLYFEPLTAEDVLEIIRVEESKGSLAGVIVQLGGQTPLKLAGALGKAGVPILGTSADAIDLAEDRKRFQQLLTKLDLKQPKNGTALDIDTAVTAAREIGYPVILRPSYVLGGRGMIIVADEPSLKSALKSGELFRISGANPVLIDGFLHHAIEIDVDAICDADGQVFIAGIMEHIEEAGIHSGDSACALPPHSINAATIAEIERQTIALARALDVRGLMNVQYAIQAGEIFVLEVNPRASRTVPFVAKAIGLPIAGIASRVMAGERLSSFSLKPSKKPHIAVKEAVLPFARFPGVDTILGPEMKSTGEVMGLDTDFGRAFAKAQIGGGTKLPLGGTVFISVKDADKEYAAGPAGQLIGMGFEIVATRGTAKYLQAAGLPVRLINKVLEGRPHIVDAMKNGEISLVFNTTDGAQALTDSASIRKTALAAENSLLHDHGGRGRRDASH